jgi:hypothetical protein
VSKKSRNGPPPVPGVHCVPNDLEKGEQVVHFDLETPLNLDNWFLSFKSGGLVLLSPFSNSPAPTAGDRRWPRITKTHRGEHEVDSLVLPTCSFSVCLSTYIWDKKHGLWPRTPLHHARHDLRFDRAIGQPRSRSTEWLLQLTGKLKRTNNAALQTKHVWQYRQTWFRYDWVQAYWPGIKSSVTERSAILYLSKGMRSFIYREPSRIN